MLRKKIAVIFTTFLLSLSAVQGESSLPYPQSEAVKRQTGNMNDIEKQLEQLLAVVNAPITPQQQALLAQFNQGLKDNPQLKAQFDAASPEQQAAFMAQFGIIMPGAGQDQQFAFIHQRLDSVIYDLEKSGAARDHSQVQAIHNRVHAAKQRIAEIRKQQGAKTEQGLAANNTADFPEFEHHVQTAIRYVMTIKDAVLAAREITALVNQKPSQNQAWLIDSQINAVILQRHKLGLEQLAYYTKEIEQWSNQYQPLFGRSTKFKQDWNDLITAFNEVASALNNESPQSVQVLASIIEHNLQAIDYTLAPSQEDANALRLANIILTNRARYPKRGALDALAQIRSNNNLALRGYPQQSHQTAPSLSAMQTKIAQTDKYVEALIAEHARTLIADQRMPADSYNGDDKQALKDKALSLMQKHYPDLEIHSVAICCDWEHTQYSEKLREPDGTEIIKHYDYRDNQIAVAVVVNAEDAKMVVVGVRQNFISNQETIEVMAQRPMLTTNL